MKGEREMKKINLFLDPILYYMEDSSGFASSHYIDLTSGEIVSPDIDDDVTDEDVEQEDRYFRIEPVTSHEVYEIMQAFAESEESDEIRFHLYDALDGKKPFMNFKDALAEYPDTEKNFYDYKNDSLKEILRNRLEECGYEIEEETSPKKNEH